MKRMYKNMMALGGLQIANYLIPFLVLPFVSRILGPSLFGSVSYAQNIVTYLTLLVNFGFEYSATRQIALAGEDRSQRDRLFWAVITVKVVLLAVSFLILGILPLCVERVACDPQLYLFTALTNIGIVLFPTWYLQGVQQMDKMAWANFFMKLFGAALILAFVRDVSAYRLYPFLLSIASIVAGISTLVWTIRHFGIGRYSCSRASLHEVIAPAAPIFLNNLFASLYTTVNMTLLGLFVTDDIVGNFSAAQRLVMALNMIVVLPVSMAVYPEISRRFVASKTEGLAFLKRVMLYAGLAAAVVSVLTCMIAPLAIRVVYGARYMLAVDILRWLSPIPFLVMTATLLTVQGMYGLGLQRFAPWVGLTLAVLCISMNMLLLPRWGVKAVCLSWNIAEVMECVLVGLILIIQSRKPAS